MYNININKHMKTHIKNHIMKNKENEKCTFMQSKINVLFDREFVQIIFLARTFIKYFYKSYFELTSEINNGKIFFEHTWIIIFIKKYHLKTISNLTKITGINQPTLSRAVITLKNADLITKQRVGKTYVLELTKKGLDLYNELEKFFNHLNNKFKSKVKKEKIDLLINTFKEINKDLGIIPEKLEEGMQDNESSY